MTKAAGAPLCHIKHFDFLPFWTDDGSNDELGDPVSARDFEVGLPRVHEDHLDLSAVVSVDRAGCVGDEYAMAEG